MLGLYLQAGFKKAADITPSSLEGLQRAPVLWQTFLPSARHYNKYCKLVGWKNAEQMHPFYWQVRGLSLQLRLLSHGKSPFKLLGLVHLQNRVEEYVECRTDIPCELVARFGTVYQHRRGLAVEVTVTGNQRGQRVYSATGTYLMQTSLKPGPLPAYESAIAGPGESSPETAELVFSAAMVRRYAKVSGDVNPIHLSTLTARLFGFKRAIVHGMYSGATAVSELDKQQALNGKAVQLAFKRPMFVPAKAVLFSEQGDESTHFSLVSADREQAEIFFTGQID
tara:strand:- start:435 stop:1277 length:843 start_codon:yes stop_codon:yes gene_type:complete